MSTHIHKKTKYEVSLKGKSGPFNDTFLFVSKYLKNIYEYSKYQQE